MKLPVLIFGLVLPVLGHAGQMDLYKAQEDVTEHGSLDEQKLFLVNKIKGKWKSSDVHVTSDTTFSNCDWSLEVRETIENDFGREKFNLDHLKKDHPITLIDKGRCPIHEIKPGKTVMLQTDFIKPVVLTLEDNSGVRKLAPFYYTGTGTWNVARIVERHMDRDEEVQIIVEYGVEEFGEGTREYLDYSESRLHQKGFSHQFNLAGRFYRE